VRSPQVGSIEPFSAGLAMGGGMVLSALWSGREVTGCCTAAARLLSFY
jgi:hypothetical protein